MKREQATKQCNVRLLPEQIERLERIAAALGASQGQVIGRLVDAAAVPDVWRPIFNTDNERVSLRTGAPVSLETVDGRNQGGPGILRTVGK